MRETGDNIGQGGVRSKKISFFLMSAAAFILSGCCSADRQSGPILVKAIPMPPWLAKLEKENVGRAIAGDEAKIRFVVKLAEENVLHGTGGPFAAAIFESGTDRLIAVGVNVVVPAKQSWAHAEMTAFARAQNKLDNASLKGCVLASSCEPCAMCSGATLWSGVEKLIYGAPREAAEEIGFDEGYKGVFWRSATAKRGIPVVGPLLGKEAFTPFELYREKHGKIY
ncbi:MAG: nucleoside deaminase [Lentisphaeria bacterium]|nr:nucleoside deaminase [Lentisphaeria bacterium]